MIRDQQKEMIPASTGVRSRRIAFTLIPDEIRSIKKRYREFRIDIPGVALWVIDVKSGSFRAGNGFINLLEYPAEEVPSLVRDLVPIFPQGEIDEMRNKINEHLLGRTPFFKIRHNLVKKNGRTIWCISVGSVTLRTRDGSPRLIIGSTCIATMYQRNIHRLNRILRALRHERRREKTITHKLEE